MKKERNQAASLAAEEWADYRRACARLEEKGYYTEIKDCWRFFGDRQWEGLPADEAFGRDGPPFINFIKANAMYRVVTIAQNKVKAVYLPSADIAPSFQAAAASICGQLTACLDRVWDSMKLDTLRWRAVRDAVVTGDGAIYFYREGGRDCAEVLDFSSVVLADESQPDLQRQEYIIIAFRESVSRLRREAKKNGILDAEIEKIVPDGERVGGESGFGAPLEDGKALVLLKFSKDEDGIVRMVKRCREAVVLPEQSTGLRLYPIARMSWEEVRGNARARGVVAPQIPNQVEYNKTLARRALKVMETSYPKMVYNETRVDNPQDLDDVGAKIAVTSDNLPVRGIIDYLSPAVISPDAAALANDLLNLTQAVGGVSDAALGRINPENASGKAILAVQDASARVLSFQAQQHVQFIEDIAYILFDFWRAYCFEGGRRIGYYGNTGEPVYPDIPKSAMEALIVRIKVEVSPGSAFSLIAYEQTLENYMRAGMISFEELVESLPESGFSPKATLQRILRARGEAK